MIKLNTFIKTHREHVEEIVKDSIDRYPVTGESTLEKVTRTSLKNIICKGKMLRGLFVVLGYQMYGGDMKLIKDIYKLSGAVEFNHTGLLIHDDIIDRDNVRRGMPTMHKVYEKLGAERNSKDDYHYGISMAIVAGDICLYSAFRLIQESTFSSKHNGSFGELYFSKLYETVVGEMMDIDYSETNYEPTVDEIYTMHKLKTGRYTFTLPLALGALAAGASQDDISQLETLGDILGVVFQIKDDELGIYGDESKTGKAVGADVKFDKKTPIRYYLFENANKDETTFLKSVFGNENLTKSELLKVQSLINKYKIDELMKGYIDTYSQESVDIVNTLSISDVTRDICIELIEYNAKRDK